MGIGGQVTVFTTVGRWPFLLYDTVIAGYSIV